MLLVIMVVISVMCMIDRLIDSVDVIYVMLVSIMNSVMFNCVYVSR